MTISIQTLARTLWLSCLGLVGLSLGCKDDSPCDEGQEVRNAACYPVAAAAGSGSGSDDTGDDTAGDDTASDAGGGTDPPAGVQAEVGQPCADTAAHSDCGGHAPICAPLPSGTVCTQILCLAGEVNEGACPSGWTCLQARPMPTPSVCLNF
ncbi:MAG: hypothetical protein ABI895_20935 [Deltaproteobacteria bacterium]